MHTSGDAQASRGNICQICPAQPAGSGEMTSRNQTKPNPSNTTLVSTTTPHLTARLCRTAERSPVRRRRPITAAPEACAGHVIRGCFTVRDEFRVTTSRVFPAARLQSWTVSNTPAGHTTQRTSERFHALAKLK